MWDHKHQPISYQPLVLFLILYIKPVMCMSSYLKHNLFDIWTSLVTNRDCSCFTLLLTETHSQSFITATCALLTGSVGQFIVYTAFWHSHPTLTRMTNKSLSLRVAYQLHIFLLWRSLNIYFIDARFKAFSLHWQHKGKHSRTILLQEVFLENMLRCASTAFYF